MKKLTNLLLLIAATLIIGCATSGTNFKWDNARQIKVGTSESRVLELMGKPYTVTSIADKPGAERWVWSYAQSYVSSPISNQTDSKVYSVDIKNGKVIGVPHISKRLQD